MDDRNLTILTAEQATNLEVLKKYGLGAATTDLGLLTGGLVSDKYINEDRSLKGRTSFFWTKTKSSHKNMIVDISGNGFLLPFPQDSGGRTIRPVLESPSIYSELYSHRTKGYNGCEEVEYGEYPQDAVPYRIQIKLEKEFAKGMKKTGRSYTFDKGYLDNGEGEFSPITYDEYEYQNKKYIRAKVHASYYDTIAIQLSNCCNYKNGDYVWIEVSPVKWLIDEENKMLISKRGLVSGIRFCDKNTNYEDFDKTDIKKYLDNYMIKDLFQSEIYTYTQFDLMAEKKEVEEKQDAIKKEQIEKLMLAKQKLKEVAELLNSPQESLKIDRIKIDNLENLVFKNNGEFSEKGFIEFDDFFKDNMILRLIDLSDLDLSDVDIRNMNFSGTNIHIDPQTIYNKDMTGVNATDVHFSPFLDIFDDVVLDGAIINSPEVMIDIDKIKSYDDNTLIKGERISQHINK